MNERIGNAVLWTSQRKVWSYSPPYTEEEQNLVGKHNLVLFRITADTATGEIETTNKVTLNPSKYPEIVAIYNNVLSIAEMWLLDNCHPGDADDRA